MWLRQMAPYSDAFNPGYDAFKASQAGRTPMVYVGANDGMLHAFDATTEAPPLARNCGPMCLGLPIGQGLMDWQD